MQKIESSKTKIIIEKCTEISILNHDMLPIIMPNIRASNMPFTKKVSKEMMHSRIE